MSQESEGLAEEAVRTAKRAVDIATGLLESRPDDSGTASSLLAALVAVASTARRAGFEDDACAAMQEAVALAERRASAAVGDSERETLVALLWGLAGDLTATERHEEAVRTAERAVALSRALDLSVHDGQARLASALFGLSEALKKAQRFGEAVERAEEAVEIRSTLLKTAEDGIDARRHLAVTLLGLGDALSLDGRIVDVPATVRRAALISLKLAQETAGSEMYLALARASLERLCRSLRDAGRVDEAIEFEDQLRDLDSPPE